MTFWIADRHREDQEWERVTRPDPDEYADLEPRHQPRPHHRQPAMTALDIDISNAIRAFDMRTLANGWN